MPPRGHEFSEAGAVTRGRGDAQHRRLEVLEQRGDGDAEEVLAGAAEAAERLAVERGHLVLVEKEKLEERRRRRALAERLGKGVVRVDRAEALAEAGDVREDVERAARRLAA